MADDADRADKIINETINSSIDKLRNKLKPNNLKYCIDCEDEIGEARKLAMPSAKRCIECESLIK